MPFLDMSCQHLCLLHASAVKLSAVSRKVTVFDLAATCNLVAASSKTIWTERHVVLVAGVPSQQATFAHSMMCMSAATGQLRALSEKLQANSYYVYSEAAPAHARSSSALTERQLAAYPDLIRTLSQSGQPVTSDIKLVEMSTLGGTPVSCFNN